MTDEQLKPFGFHDKSYWIVTLEKQRPGKKFKPGTSLKGPEFPGCFNTGFRATIRRHLVDGAFIVGREMDVEEVARQRCFSAPGKREIGSLLSKRSWPIDGRRTVHVFHTRKPAVELFAALCEKDSREHAAERAEIAALQARVRENPLDMQSALQLADHM